jgi:hypothetical protein
MWLEIVKSKLTNKAKALLITKYINKNIITYKETITHDGNISEYFESNIYTFDIKFYDNEILYTHTYIMEDWFENRPINYELYDKHEL